MGIALAALSCFCFVMAGYEYKNVKRMLTGTAQDMVRAGALANIVWGIMLGVAAIFLSL